jgi:hypothetical protein
VRKSTVILLVLMLAGFGGMLLAAQGVLQPMAKDAELARELTALLGSRGDIAEGTHVRAVRAAGGERRLAKEGTGLLVDLSPSRAVMETRRALEASALRIAREALMRHAAQNLKWVEVVFFVEGREDGERLRTLVAVGPGGALLGPQPALPERYPPPSAVPSAPAPSEPAPAAPAVPVVPAVPR